MNKNINRDKIVILFILALIFSGSFGIQCARPSMPMGGPKDTIPPIAIKMSPPNYQTSSTPNEIVMEFNEFMQLKSQQTEIVFSPPMEVKPIVEVRGKTVVTTYPHDFKFDSATTYMIDYGSALVDNNEGNAARQLKYVFSPGKHIDSLSMSGQAIDAKTGDTLINALVYLFESISDTVTIDSTLFNSDPIFMSKTDSLGVYFANHLKARDYRVYVVEDLDNNGVYNVGEERVGFIDSALNPAKLRPFQIWFDPVSRQIYASPQVHFRMFTEIAYTRQSLKEVEISKNYKIILTFASAGVEIDTLVIDSVPNEAMIKMYSKNKDSLTIWFKARDFTIPDTVSGYVKYMGLDTLGKKALVSSDFIVATRKLTEEDIEEKRDAAKEISSKGKLTLWERFLNWIRFSHNRKIKKAGRLAGIERQRVYDSLRNDPAALLKLRVDSLRLDSIRIDSLQIDSIRLDSIDQFKKDSANILKIFIQPQENFNPNGDIYIQVDYPLAKLEMDSITLFKYASDRGGDEDSFDENQSREEVKEEDREKTVEKMTFERDSLDFTRYKLIADWIEDAEYQFDIRPKAMIDILGASNDTTVHNLKTVESRKTSTVVVDVEGVDGCYFLELVLDGKSIEYKHIITKDSIYTARLLPVGKYKIKVTKDRNCNGIFDDGNLIHRIMPEDIAFYVNDKGIPDITLKENFEFNISLNIKNLFNPMEGVILNEEQIEKLLNENAKEGIVATEELAEASGQDANQEELIREEVRSEKIEKKIEKKKNIK